MDEYVIIGMLTTFVKQTLVGMGALKGAACQIQSITDNGDSTHTITFEWEDNDGVSHTSSLTLEDGVTELSALSDVDLTGIADGKVLSWDAANSKWVVVTNSATVNTLSAVGDVTITSIAGGDALVWDATTSKWINKALATVAISGSYNDLSNKPSIPDAQVQSDWNESDDTKVDFIKNKPTIPAAQIQSDWTQADNTKLDFIKNKPSLLELGETSSTAYRGDRGKTAYDHSQIVNGTNPHGTTADNVNLATALTINGASKTTAEAAISALAGLVDNITDTEYNAISAVLGN